VKHLNCKLYCQKLQLKYLCKLARYWLQAHWGWHDSVETCRCVIICEIIVHLLITEQNKPSLFETRVLRKTLRPTGDDVWGEWRRLRNEELHDLHSSSNIFRLMKFRIMRWAGHVTNTRDRRGAYKVLVERPEGKRQLGRPRRWWENNIRMDLQELGWGGMDWIDLVQGKER